MKCHRRILWYSAIVSYGLGDIVTTIYGLVYYDSIEESHTYMNMLIQHLGLSAIIIWKMVVIGLFIWFYRKVPKPYDLGILIGLNLVGVAITIWNISRLKMVAA